MDLEDFNTTNVAICKCDLHDPESPTTPTNDQTIEADFDKLIASGNSMNLITTLMTPIGRKSFTPTSTPVKIVKSLRRQPLGCSHYERLSCSLDFASDDEDNAKIKEAIDKSILESQENCSQIDKRRHFIKVLPDSPHKGLCPKMAKILEDAGLDKYKNVFKKEEIDFFVFEMMTEDDFITIGINSKSERDYFLNIVQ